MRAPWLFLLALSPGCSGSGREMAPASEPTENGEPRRSPERVEERRSLAALLERRGIRDARVLQAIRDVPRHWFVPERLASLAYEDDALPIEEGQTISQPFVVALMTEALELRGDSKVLEVGTGSGYQAAVLSEITPRVYTIEIVPELARGAAERLARHGYGSIRCRQGDGWKGWPEEAPFDAVIVTAAPPEVPRELFEQLAPGGRMCIPVGQTTAGQDLLLVRKLADGSMAEESIAPVRFVPMTGGDR